LAIGRVRMDNSWRRYSAFATVLKSAVLVIVIFLAGLVPVRATEFVALDGNWWTSLTDEQQLTAIQGILSGYETGYNNGYLAAGLNDVLHYHSTRSGAQLTEDPASDTHFSKTFGAYQQEITDFYSRYPGSMGLTVGDVLSCLSDNPQFTCEQVSKWQQ
jgi:hypothetical protein